MSNDGRKQTTVSPIPAGGGTLPDAAEVRFAQFLHRESKTLAQGTAFSPSIVTNEI